MPSLVLLPFYAKTLFFIISIIINEIVSTFHHGFWQLVIIKLCPEWQRVNYNVRLTLWYLYSGYITEFMTFYLRAFC